MIMFHCYAVEIMLFSYTLKLKRNLPGSLRLHFHLNLRKNYSNENWWCERLKDELEEAALNYWAFLFQLEKANIFR